MKALFILLLAASSFGQSIQERVNQFDKPKDYEVTYDKFQKVTSVEYRTSIKSSKSPKGFIASKQAYFIAIMSIPDKDPPSMSWFLADVGGLLSDETLRILADGDLLESEQATGMDRSAIFPITATQMDKIVKAKIVEFQLFLFEGKFDAATLTALKNLASLTKPEPPRQP